MILDTNALSAHAGRDQDLRLVLDEAELVRLNVISLGEYRFGLRGSRLRAPLEAWLDARQGTLPVLNVDARTAVHYAAIRAELKAAGTPIPVNDLWIAAIARQHGLEVVSRDTHFDQVTGLARRSW